MNYAAWKLFIDASELGSLSKVAVAYGTSQPHISRQISDLETECGGRLFQRTGRGVVLTELGVRMLPKVRAWLTSTEQLANDIRSTASKPIGTVRLGILPSTAHPLVSTLYYRLKERYPLVQLSVREGQGAMLETWLENGSVDLAILLRYSPMPRNGDSYLLEKPTFLVGAAGDLLTSKPDVPFSALDKLPLVTFCRPSAWRDRLDQLAAENGVSLNIVAEADSLSLQTHIVAAGSAYALLGPYATAAAVSAGKLQASKVIDPLIPRHIALSMSPHGELTLACKAVMQLTKEIAQSGVAEPWIDGSVIAL